MLILAERAQGWLLQPEPQLPLSVLVLPDEAFEEGKSAAKGHVEEQ